MNNDEAIFILSAYRPDGQDATDPLFAEPLAQARRDPALKDWFGAQLRFDSLVSAKIREVPVPPGLREAILAGARVSMSRRAPPWHRRWPWFAAVAAAIVMAGALVTLRWSDPSRPDLSKLTRFALRDTAVEGMKHIGSVAALRDTEELLAATRLRSAVDLNLDLARLRADGCRSVRVAGREVLEICFGRDHEFHLYLAARGDFAATQPTEPSFSAAGPLSAAGWADARFAYALVTSAGASALRQRL
ncbi:MAG: hypothetical protein HY736_16600 [Verrucomicrobia bacterium]|nr:hypothetical protein [Verrucomicrobiota bacterium]